MPEQSSITDQAGNVAPGVVSQVREVIEMIRPAVQFDGGDVELVGIQADGTVLVRLHGACVGCPSSKITLKAGIERQLVERVAGITQVQEVA